jgi:hypothetical protein
MILISKNLKSLKDFPSNSKIHTPKQIQVIKNSIREYGVTQPLIIDENDVILAGHGRKIALLECGFEDAPCIVLEGLSENDKKKYVMLDNQSNAMTGFDMNILLPELTSLVEDVNYDFEVCDIGFDIDILDSKLSDDKKENEDEGLQQRKTIECPSCGREIEL